MLKLVSLRWSTDQLDASCPQMLKFVRQDRCSKLIGNVSFEAVSSASSAFKHATDSQILNIEVDSEHKATTRKTKT
jgi:hypothetical protein